MKSRFEDTKIIILCGGKGKRMRKYTKVPKPLLKLGKLTIIEHKLNYYKKQGLKNFIFCTGYKGNILKKFLKEKCNNSKFFHGKSNFGILKRIYSAKKIITTSTIISYGDTLAKINFKDLIKKHKKSNAVMSIIVAPIQNPFGIVNWDSKKKLQNFVKNPYLTIL